MLDTPVRVALATERLIVFSHIGDRDGWCDGDLGEHPKAVLEYLLSRLRHSATKHTYGKADVRPCVSRGVE